MQRKARDARWPSFVWQTVAEHLDLRDMSVCDSVSRHSLAQLRSVCLRNITHVSRCEADPDALLRFLRRHSCLKVEVLTLVHRFVSSWEFALPSLTRLTLHVTRMPKSLDLRNCNALEYLELASTAHKNVIEQFLYPTSPVHLVSFSIHDASLGLGFASFLSRCSGLRHLTVTLGFFLRAQAGALMALTNLESLSLTGCHLDPTTISTLQHLVSAGTLRVLRTRCCCLRDGPRILHFDAATLVGEDGLDNKCRVEACPGLGTHELTPGKELWIRDDEYGGCWRKGKIIHAPCRHPIGCVRVAYDDWSEAWNASIPEIAPRFLPLHPNDRHWGCRKSPTNFYDVIFNLNQ